MTSRKEFVGRTKADVKRKIQEFEAKSMRVNQKDYRKMTLGECIDNILQTLEPTFKTNNYATLQSTNRCYIKTNPIADVQMAAIDKIVIQTYYTNMSKKYSESTVKKTRTLFNIVFDYLVSCNIITENPAKGIKMPHKSKYAVQKKELLKRKKAEESKKRTHRLCQVGGAVESVLGAPIEEEDIPKLIGFLKKQEANGKFFSKAMQKETNTDMEEV